MVVSIEGGPDIDPNTRYSIVMARRELTQVNNRFRVHRVYGVYYRVHKV